MASDIPLSQIFTFTDLKRLLGKAPTNNVGSIEITEDEWRSLTKKFFLAQPQGTQTPENGWLPQYEGSDEHLKAKLKDPKAAIEGRLQLPWSEIRAAQVVPHTQASSTSNDVASSKIRNTAPPNSDASSPLSHQSRPSDSSSSLWDTSSTETVVRLPHTNARGAPLEKHKRKAQDEDQPSQPKKLKVDDDSPGTLASSYPKPSLRVGVPTGPTSPHDRPTRLYSRPERASEERPRPPPSGYYNLPPHTHVPSHPVRFVATRLTIRRSLSGTRTATQK